MACAIGSRPRTQGRQLRLGDGQRFLLHREWLLEFFCLLKFLASNLDLSLDQTQMIFQDEGTQPRRMRFQRQRDGANIELAEGQKSRQTRSQRAFLVRSFLIAPDETISRHSEVAIEG